MPRVHDGLDEARAFCTSAMASPASVLTPRKSELIFISYFGLIIMLFFVIAVFFSIEHRLSPSPDCNGSSFSPALSFPRSLARSLSILSVVSSFTTDCGRFPSFLCSFPVLCCVAFRAFHSALHP